MVGPWIALDHDDVETVLGKSFSRRERHPFSPRAGRGRERGPLRRAELRGQNLQRLGANRCAQNCGEAPSPSVASRPRPLPAQRGEVRTCESVLATQVRPSFANTTRKKPNLIPS